jgi:hypothetical protein
MRENQKRTGCVDECRSCVLSAFIPDLFYSIPGCRTKGMQKTVGMIPLTSSGNFLCERADRQNNKSRGAKICTITLFRASTSRRSSDGPSAASRSSFRISRKGPERSAKSIYDNTSLALRPSGQEAAGRRSSYLVDDRTTTTRLRPSTGLRRSRAFVRSKDPGNENTSPFIVARNSA